jgi:hypothetical protein
MTDERVELGFATMVLHDPDKGYEAAFNRWYERDHFYGAGMFAPYTFGGQRWVATKRLKDLRYPDQGPFDGGIRAGSYLTFMWIQAGHLKEEQGWVAEEHHKLVAAGRTFAHRSMQTVTVQQYVGGAFRDPDGVPAELALDHRYPGLCWTSIDRTGDVPLDKLTSTLLEETLPSAMVGTPIAMTLVFTPKPKDPWWPDDAPDVPGVGDRLVLVQFLETDPVDCWEESLAGLGNTLEGTGMARTLYVAPFIPTVPGTDMYTDELW